jgi:hypothetical protein
MQADKTVRAYKRTKQPESEEEVIWKSPPRKHEREAA